MLGDMESVSSQSSTVLIVGAGPAGMTAALELSRLQIPVRIIDKVAEPTTTSRAISVQPRTLELLEQRGLVEPMLQKGAHGVASNIYGQGKVVARADFSQNGSNYPYILFIPQAETERLLRDALEKQGVAIERAVEFVALSQGDADRSDHVKAILKHSDGKLEEFDCAYLISTEGARSVARTTLNLQFKGKTRDEFYILGDVIIEGDLAPNELHIFPSEHGVLGILPLGDGTRFRVMAAHPTNTPTKDKMPTLEELQAIFDTRSHIPAKLSDMIWSSWFRINSRMVDRLKVGRVFLGGDSAHIHSPVGGQGMNTGIQDMINLAWKLAFVMKGQADPKILNTYADDRIPVIRNIVYQTDTNTDRMGNRGWLFRSAFNFIVPLLAGRNFIQKNVTANRAQISLNYRESPLSVSHNAAGKIQGGDRVPNVKVQTVGKEGDDKSDSLFSILNTDLFTLLFANLTKTESTLQSAQSGLGSWETLIQTYHVAAAPGEEQSFQSVFGSQSSLILVRPDGYVAFAGTEHSLEELAKYLTIWFPVQK